MLGCSGLLFLAFGLSRAQLDYNEQGRCFVPSEGVVYHWQTVEVLAIASGLCLTGSLVFGIVSYSIRRSVEVE